MPDQTQKQPPEENQQVTVLQTESDASSTRARDCLAKDSSDTPIENEESPVGTSEFQLKLLGGLMQDCYKFQPNNIDPRRSGMGTPGRIDGMPARLKRRLKDRLLLFARRRGFIRVSPAKAMSKRLKRTLRNIDKLERFYSLLQDDYSRQLLIELLKFRILRRRHVRLPSNNKEYWAKYNSVDNFLKELHTFKTSSWNRYLDRYGLQGDSGSLNIHTYPEIFLDIFLLEQYTYQKGRKTIKVEPGDTVIDGGACYGDSSLYFADKAAPNGRVYCFEFDPENLGIFHENINLNRHLGGNLKVVSKALYNRSGEIIGYNANGPMTSLDTEQQRTAQVSTLSIDDFVREEKIEKVDFLKLDIEGFELAALQGAEETLRSFRPKLAIALYHKEEDFVTIPDYLDKLSLGYEFFLDHFTVKLQETVLFASPKVD